MSFDDGVKVNGNYGKNKEIFWENVNEVRSGTGRMPLSVKSEGESR